jgi:hypothetical protein
MSIQRRWTPLEPGGIFRRIGTISSLGELFLAAQIRTEDDSMGGSSTVWIRSMQGMGGTMVLKQTVRAPDETAVGLGGRYHHHSASFHRWTFPSGRSRPFSWRSSCG